MAKDIAGSNAASKPSFSAKSTSPASSAAATRADRSGSSVSSLVLARELDGKILDLTAKMEKKRRCAFEDEFLKSQVTQPQVWKYDDSADVAKCALEIVPANLITPEGERQIPALFGGNTRGKLRFFAVGSAGKHLRGWEKCTPRRVWPCSEDNGKRDKPAAQLWKVPRAYMKLPTVSEKRTVLIPPSTGKELKVFGNIDSSCTAYMPKCVSSLLALQLYDQHFLASSMDGSIKLYDLRYVKKGPVQSYEGKGNNRCRLQLGVDPSEKFVVSGGVDLSLRVWSIWSGELLYENKLFSSVPFTVCTQTAEGSSEAVEESCMDYLHEQSNCWGSWHGSRDGLFYTRWC